MRIDLLRAIPEWIEAGLITPEAAEQIKAYYAGKEPHGPNRIVIVFGILGALLVGLGITLIVANNWEDLPRGFKTVLAFAPLLIGQLACAFTLWRKPESTAWREGSTTFLFFAVGVSISLVAQIYHIGDGALGPYLLTWSLLCFPLMYVMRASFASLLYWVVITYFLYETGFNNYYLKQTASPYWWLVLLAMPYYVWLILRKPHSNFTAFHHWGIPGSLLLAYATVSENASGALLFWSYFLLFGIAFLLGQSHFLQQRNLWRNGYAIIGAGGMLSLLFTTSFSSLWEDVNSQTFFEAGWLQSLPGMAIVLFLIVTGVLLFINYREAPSRIMQPLMIAPLVFSAAFLIGENNPLLPTILINVLLLVISVSAIWQGARRVHLGLVNGGLLLLTVQIACRFFDTDIPFVARGLVFIAVGAGFFFANYRLLGRKKSMQS